MPGGEKTGYMASDVTSKESEPKTIEVSIQEVQEGHTNGAPILPIGVAEIGYEGDLEVDWVGPEDFEPETLLHVFRSMYLARRLGRLGSENRLLAAIYILAAFFGLPLLMLFITGAL